MCEVRREGKTMFMLIHVEQMSNELENFPASTKSIILQSITRFTALPSGKQGSWVPSQATSIFFKSPETKRWSPEATEGR